MSQAPDNLESKRSAASQHPFRRAVLRGLAIVLPPLLTIVVFLWMWNMIDSYVLRPIEDMAEGIIVWSIKDIRTAIPKQAEKAVLRDANGKPLSFRHGSATYVPFRDKWLPQSVKQTVDSFPDEHLYELTTARNYYRNYVRMEYLGREMTIPVFLMVFVLFLYLIGKLMAVGVGNILWGVFERLIHRLPIIRTVYSAAKQVTDFIFKEQEVEFTRVVAVEYPRKGIWSMGFVTGESFLDIRSAANEPVLSVLMPTSPMPATGFTVTVPKSETIDLDITVDQAVQFCVSCGVVVPPHQQADNQDIVGRIKAAISRQGGNGQPGDSTTPQRTTPAEDSAGGG